MVGGLVWAAPVISTATAAGASATTPVPCACTASAYGLRVRIASIIDETFGVGNCVADVNLGALGVLVRASAVCGPVQGCEADASIATLDITVPGSLPTSPSSVIHVEILTSEANASCDPCSTTGSSTIARLTVTGPLGNGAVTVTGACNETLLGGILVLNEQTCDGGTRSVNALHLNVLGLVEVIAAHTQAGGTGCTCVPCV